MTRPIDLAQKLKEGPKAWNAWRAATQSAVLRIENADFTKCDLQGVNLSHCILDHSHFDGAILTSATFTHSSLRYCSLKDTDFSYAQVDFCKFEKATLMGTKFLFSNLRDSDLGRLTLHEVDLSCALLDGTDLQFADIQHCQFDDYADDTPVFRARNYALAFLPATYLRRANFDQNHNENVRRRRFLDYKFDNMNLGDANFSGATLDGASFREADLKGATFDDARLQMVDFRKAKNVTPDQLLAAKNWKMAFLSNDLFNVLRDSQHFCAYDVEQFEEHNTRVGIKNFSGYNLSNADLRETNLENSTLIRVRLANCDLSGSNLTRAKLDRADLTEARMEKCTLVESSLRGSKMKRAILDASDLSGATLFRTDLAEARLRGCQFSNAVLEKARLAHSDLRNADLSSTRGLCVGQLSGTNLVNTKLPSDVAKFDATVTLKECMDKSSNIFTLLSVACVTCVLTILITSGGDMVNPGTKLNLGGLLLMQVPVRVFGWFMPLVLLSLLAYYQVHLRSAWIELSGLPAWFPDGRPLDRKAYPWLLSTLVSAALPLLRRRLPRHFVGEFAVCVIMNWYFVFLTIAVIWYRYLSISDLVLSCAQVLALAVAVFIGSISFAKAFWTMRHGWAYHNVADRVWGRRALIRGFQASLGTATIFGAITIAKLR